MKRGDNKNDCRNGTIASDSIIIMMQCIFNNYGFFTYY